MLSSHSFRQSILSKWAILILLASPTSSPGCCTGPSLKKCGVRARSRSASQPTLRPSAQPREGLRIWRERHASHAKCRRPAPSQITFTITGRSPLAHTNTVVRQPFHVEIRTLSWQASTS